MRVQTNKGTLDVPGAPRVEFNPQGVTVLSGERVVATFPGATLATVLPTEIREEIIKLLLAELRDVRRAPWMSYSTGDLLKEIKREMRNFDALRGVWKK